MKQRHYLIITIILIVVCLLAGVTAYLKWDDSKGSREIIDMEKSFLQSELERLPEPEEMKKGEDEIKQGRFKGIISYYIEPASQNEADDYNTYLQSDDTWYLGTYVALEGKPAGVLVGSHYYSSILEKLGYGWFSREGNLYADYSGKEEEKGKPNYRNRYDFYLVKDMVICKFVIFCNQSDPEKALSSAIDYICEL